MDRLIRKLRAEDAPAIEALYAAAMAVEPGIGPVSADQWLRAMALPQFHGGREFLVAEHHGEVIGLAESSRRGDDTRRARQVKIVVAPSFRRQGLGTRLLRAVLAQDPAGGPVTLQCHVKRLWAAGLAFVGRYGFAEIEREITMRSAGPILAIAPPQGVDVGREEDAGPHEARLAEIHNAGFRGDSGFTPFEPEDAVRQAADCELWTARRGNRTVAYALIEAEPGLRWLETIAVDPAYRARGIGGALISAALGPAAADCPRASGLSVSSRNPIALRLYQRLGFAPRSETLGYAAARDDLLTALPS